MEICEMGHPDGVGNLIIGTQIVFEMYGYEHVLI